MRAVSTFSGASRMYSSSPVSCTFAGCGTIVSRRPVRHASHGRSPYIASSSSR